MSNAEVFRQRPDASLHSRFINPELQWAEGDVLADGGTEQLNVRVLENQPDASPETRRKPLVREHRLGQFLAHERDASHVGEHKAVQQVQERGLSATIGAQECDSLSA